MARIALSQNEFMKRLKDKRGARYIYSKTIYKNRRTNIVVTCRIHGDFKQNPYFHLVDMGNCPECSFLGVARKNRTHRLGKKHTEETKKKISLNNAKTFLGKHHTEENKKKFSENAKNRTPEHLKKLRIARLKQVEENYGKFSPNYNRKACEWFREFDLKNNTKGRYALYGDGEFLIKGLGYWVDYINFDKKLIIEWDEKAHLGEKKKMKDVIKEKEIRKLFPDFNFLRIQEWRVKPSLVN